MQIYSDFQTSVRRALTEIDHKWETYPGLIICGTHSPKEDEVDFLVGKIKDARENKIPYLGICYGRQLEAIEYARNVSGIKDATSEEFGIGTFVVKKNKQLNVGQKNGESYWNNYEVVIDFQSPSHFFTTQSHPEYQSAINDPHPLLVKFLKYASKS